MLSTQVLNTDAEGRLTLADALVYAEKQGATEIIDIATLTGACIVSLGMDYAGLWANNETMAQSIKDSSAAAGEKLWHMPLCEESYGEMVKSKIAGVFALLFPHQIPNSTPFDVRHLTLSILFDGGDVCHRPGQHWWQGGWQHYCRSLPQGVCQQVVLGASRHRR